MFVYVNEDILLTEKIHFLIKSIESTSKIP